MTAGFKVEVGIHQGLTLSPFLFAMVMDRLTDEVRQESPLQMTLRFAVKLKKRLRGAYRSGDIHLREEK